MALRKGPCGWDEICFTPATYAAFFASLLCSSGTLQLANQKLRHGKSKLGQVDGTSTSPRALCGARSSRRKPYIARALHPKPCVAAGQVQVPCPQEAPAAHARHGAKAPLERCWACWYWAAGPTRRTSRKQVSRSRGKLEKSDRRPSSNKDNFDHMLAAW